MLKWSPDQWLPLTLRELTDAHDAHLMEKWDHTATMAALIHNLSTIVVGLTSKRTPKPRTMADFHPFRETKQRGLQINAENIHVLRMIATAYGGGGGKPR